MIGRLNKIFYFLWYTQAVEFDFDKDKNVIVKNTNGEPIYSSQKEDVSIYEIFFLKHIPAVLLTVMMIHIPNLLHILIGVVIFTLGYLVVKFIPKHFKKYIFLLAFIGAYCVFYDLEVLFEQSLYVVSMIILAYFIGRDIYNLFIKEDIYYYLEDVSQELNIKGTRTKPAKKKLLGFIPFFGLTNGRQNINWAKLSFGGHYLKVKKEELENETVI